MDTVKVTTGVRASYSLGEGESGAKHDCRQGRVLTSQDLVVQLLNGVNRVSLETIARFNQESRSSGRFVMMKQA